MCVCVCVCVCDCSPLGFCNRTKIYQSSPHVVYVCDEIAFLRRFVLLVTPANSYRILVALARYVASSWRKATSIADDIVSAKTSSAKIHIQAPTLAGDTNIIAGLGSSHPITSDAVGTQQRLGVMTTAAAGLTTGCLTSAFTSGGPPLLVYVPSPHSCSLLVEGTYYRALLVFFSGIVFVGIDLPSLTV